MNTLKSQEDIRNYFEDIAKSHLYPMFDAIMESAKIQYTAYLNAKDVYSRMDMILVLGHSKTAIVGMMRDHSDKIKAYMQQQGIQSLTTDNILVYLDVERKFEKEIDEIVESYKLKLDNLINNTLFQF